VIIDCGTAFEGYHAPANWLTLMPVGSPAPPPGLAALSLASAKVNGEGTTTATVTLNGPAPAGGAQVQLSGSMEGQVVTPQNVTIPEGNFNAIFTITAPQVNTPHYVFIQGTYGTTGGTQAALLEIDPALPSVATLLAFGAKPSSAIGGDSIRGTVGLIMPAPAGGGPVTLSSDNPSVAQVPATLSIATGNSADSFTITTAPVLTATTVRIDASAGGVTKSVFLNLGPDPNAPPLLSSITLNATTVVGGNNVIGTVFLSAPAPAGGASVTLSTSNFSAGQAQPVVIVAAGQTSANFTVTTFSVSANTTVTITAFLGSASRSTALTVTQGSAPPPTPGTPSLLSPANAAQVTQPITLDWSDASNAASYEIQVDDSSNFTTPLVRSLTSTASQTTVSGLTSVQHWWRVRGKNSAGVAGNWSGSSRFTPVAAPPSASLSAVSVNPTSVAGGNSSQGAVTLTSGAPLGGAVVGLSSSQVVASVPASVTVSAGATSASFTITSSSVSASTAVTITATYNSVQQTATLTVNPAALGPLPAPSQSSPGSDARFSFGQQINFDWSDVAGAAGYTIQIDDRNDFPAPLILNQTTTGSSFSTSSLARADMWWRVRANDGAGNPGTWSAVRRFRIQ
jgi:hypothetical protein